MRLSRLPRTLPTFLFIATLVLTLSSTISNATIISSQKRALLGNLLPVGSSSNSQPPAPASAGGAPAPTAPSATSNGAVDTTNPNSTTTGPLPGLISQVLNPPPIIGNIGGAPLPPATTTASITFKKHPSTSATETDNNDTDNESSPNTPAQTTGTEVDDGHSNTSNNNSPLSPGMIVLLVIILLAVVAGVLFSCYRIRQSRRRRYQSWNEEILKNHAGNLGYNESGGGYGMYIGGGKDRPDLFRMTLDKSHRG